MIAGGGTGGHAIPALCVAESLRERGAVVEFVGSSTGIETDLVPRAGFVLHSLPLKALAGGPIARLQAGAFFARALLRCRSLIKRFGPQAVLGVGGYASAPAVISSSLLKIPTFLHEQNSVPGRVNRFSSRFTDQVLLTFPEAEDFLGNTTWVGMPTRKQLFGVSKEKALEALGLEPPVVLIFGGSGGALKINLAAAEAFGETTSYTVAHISGRRDFSRLSTNNLRHHIVAYTDEIWRYLAASEVAVIRSGAGSLFDAAAAQRATLAIPFPYATGQHQLHNAHHFTERGAAVLLPDDEVTAESLKEGVEALLFDDERRENLAARIGELATPKAADKIANKLLEVASDAERMRN